MSTIKSISSSKVLTVVMAFAVAAVMLFAGVTLTKAATEAELQAQIDALLAQIQELQAQLAGDGGSESVSSLADFNYTFTKSFSKGDSDAEVKKVQEFLNLVPGISVASSGAGSPGNETEYYGSLSHAAAVAFQEKYSADVLEPLGLSAGTGYWGASSRAKANELIANAEDTTGDTGDTGDSSDDGDSGVDVGFTGLKVTDVDQPDANLAPLGASRVPFTNFTVEAGNEDVTIDEVVAEADGLATDDVFDSIVLLDEDGNQLGDSDSPNNDSQAQIGKGVIVKAGESMTFTIAGNMIAYGGGEDTQSGNVANIKLVSINTSASIDADFPIAGANHTINTGLSTKIGSVTLTEGSLNPSASNESVGTADYTFAAMDIDNTGDEDVMLKTVRLEQAGSASASDLSDVVMVVDGTEYDVTVDGDVYSSNFGGDGIVIEEDEEVQVSIKGDIVDGVNSTVEFEIDETSDVFLEGLDYGYGIKPSSSDVSSINTDFVATTIKTGNLTFSKSSAVPAGDIVNGADDVSLGSFTIRTAGEGITWDSVEIGFVTSNDDITNTTSSKYIENVSLVDANGSTVAGPEDPSSSTNYSDGSAVLDDTVELDVGEHTLIVKADLSDGWVTNDTIKAVFNQDSLDDLEGLTSGETISTSEYNTGETVGSVQTISAGSLTASLSSSFVDQNIIDDSTGETIARMKLDASGSGEDVIVNTVKVAATSTPSGDLGDLSNVKLVTSDGEELTMGGNIENPSSGASDITFQLDGNGFVVPKGTTVEVDVVANLNSAGDGSTYKLGLSTAGGWEVEGDETGNDVLTLSNPAGNVTTVTVSDAGDATVSVDSSDPTSEVWCTAGGTETVGIFEISATNEDINLKDIEFDFANGTDADVTGFSILDGAVTANVDDSGNVPFSLSTGDFTVESYEDKNLTVKATFADIGVTKSGSSGQLVNLSTTTNPNNNRASGVASQGTTIYLSGDVGTTTGARYFKSLPVVAVNDPSGSWNTNDTEIYDFDIFADEAGDVAVRKLTFDINVDGTNATATDFKLYADGDLVATTDSTEVSNESQNITITVANGTYGEEQVTIPAGTGNGVNFSLKADIDDGNSDDNDDITVDLVGDSTFDGMKIASGVSGNLVWSPLSTTTDIATNDWANGAEVDGMADDDDAPSKTIDE